MQFSISYTRLIALFICTLSVGIMIISPSYTSAQTSASDEVFLEIDPATPAPHEVVSLTIKSFVIDLERSTITWFINDKEVLRGVGSETLSTKIAGPGELTQIDVVIERNGATIRKTLRIYPSTVDILWEAVDAYVPPFYKGKALAPKQGIVRFTALAGPTLGNEVIYDWTKDFENFGSASGYLRNTFTYQASLLDKALSVGVTATNKSSSRVAQQTITVPLVDPEPVLYSLNEDRFPNYTSALGRTFFFNTPTTELIIAPYYMTVQKLKNLTYDWRINGNSVSNIRDNNHLFISSDGGSGSGEVSIEIKHPVLLLQSIKTLVRIIF
jgi:hypothetical protein